MTQPWSHPGRVGLNPNKIRLPGAIYRILIFTEIFCASGPVIDSRPIYGPLWMVMETGYPTAR